MRGIEKEKECSVSNVPLLPPRLSLTGQEHSSPEKKPMNYLVVLPEKREDDSAKIIYTQTYEVAVKLRDSVEGSVIYTKEEYNNSKKT